MSPHYAPRPVPLLQAGARDARTGCWAYLVQVSREYDGGSSRMPGVMNVEQLNTRPLAVVALKVSSAPPRKSSLPLVTGPMGKPGRSLRR